MKRKIIDLLLLLLYLVCIVPALLLWCIGSAGALVEWLCDGITTWWANGYTELCVWARGGYNDL